MKDEYAGRILECFYGIGAKAYCVKCDELMKKAKRVSKNVVDKEIGLEDYVQIVQSGGVILRKMYIFKSTLHTIYTELKNKIALSSGDDKRCIGPDGIHTKAWGHYLHQDTSRNLELLIQEAEKLIALEQIGDWDFDISLFDM